MRAIAVFVLSAAVSGLSGQTAVEYGATAGKAAAVAAGIGVAVKGTMRSTAGRLDRSKDTPIGVPRRRVLQGVTATDVANAASASTAAARRNSAAFRATAAGVPGAPAAAAQPTPTQSAILRASQPLPPPKEPTVIDPSALKAGMPRADLDAMGTPAMSITDAEGETRIYKTAKGSVSVLLKAGKIAVVQL